MDYFSQLAPYIQNYIYRNNWQELTDIQNKAIPAILDTQNNILLSSSTASGKTEAAFFPILTDLYNRPSKTISVIYISPLIALINDQFERLDGLLEDEDIPIVRWHGHSLQTPKKKVIKNPQGIIQITPESLEALVMRQGVGLNRLFGDLRYIVIDEIHAFIGEPRGLQVNSLIARIEHIIGRPTRHIGLSATMSDYEGAAKYLSSGNNRACSVCVSKGKKSPLSLTVKEVPFHKEDAEVGVLKMDQPILETLYNLVSTKRSIIFANTRKEVEATVTGLRDLVEVKNSHLEVYAHHGSLDRLQRGEAEEALKTSSNNVCVGATVTLELGIDVGKLDLIVQEGSVFSASSFVQRLGRTGRKGQGRAMAFVLKRKDWMFKKSATYLPLDLIKTIAILELQLKERWLEPIEELKRPYFFTLHQTLSTIKSLGALKPSELARAILTLPPMKDVSKEDYKSLIETAIDKNLLEIMEDGTINLGERGESLTSFYDFYSVFMTEDEITIKNQDRMVGTVSKELKVGERLVLAGKKWKVTDINMEKLVAEVIPDGEGGVPKWDGTGMFNTSDKVIAKMREVLTCNDDYSYLDPGSKTVLKNSRERFAYLQLDKKSLLKIEPYIIYVYMFRGTKALRALVLALQSKGYRAFIENDFSVSVEKGNLSISSLKDTIRDMMVDDFDFMDFDFDVEEYLGKFKYDRFLPSSLAKREYLDYATDIKSMKDGLKELMI
jgi:ATP-dependent Lhr-like helicase